MSELSKVVILIPSYEPDEKLPKLLNELQGLPFGNILIVNDGSGERYEDIFNECRAFPNVEVIGYETNRGKGFAFTAVSVQHTLCYHSQFPTLSMTLCLAPLFFRPLQVAYPFGVRAFVLACFLSSLFLLTSLCPGLSSLDTKIKMR